MTRSSINKIIVSGCSFTNWPWSKQKTWAQYIEDTVPKGISVVNIGRPGNSNEFIIPEVIQEASKSDDNCLVLVQLTGLDRVSVNGEMSPTVGSILKSLSMNWFGMSQNEGASAGWKNYFLNEYSEEKHFNKLLNLILELQTALTKRNIDYRIMLGWDVLTQKGESYMWDTKKRYHNKNDKMLKDKYSSSMILWDKINWNKFWFFENEKIKYGGISQWVQYNLEPKEWYNNLLHEDRHPSPKAHKDFAEKVVNKLIEEML